jgi:large exoprotein involved in heme utilization and adhesion
MRAIILMSFLILSTYAYGQCDKIETMTDKFTGQITTYSPSLSIQYMKIIKSADTSMALVLTSYGQTVHVGKKGVIILLSDSSKIDLPNIKINVDVTSGKYRYRAVVVLTAEIKNTLINSNITDFRLYIYDTNIVESERDTFRNYLKCLLNK